MKKSCRRINHSCLRFLSTKDVSRDEKKPLVPKKTRDIRRLFKLYAPEKKGLAISTTALGVSTSITMCVPAGMGHVIDIVSDPVNASQLPTIAAGLGGLFVVGAISNVIRVNVSGMIGERITARLRQDTFSSILNQEIAFFDKTRTGELINRLSSDTTEVGSVLSSNMSQGLRSTAQAIGSVSMLFYTCSDLAMMMCAVVPPVAIGAVSYGRYVKGLTTKVQKQLSGATELAEERLGNIRIVRWFAAEETEKDNYRRQIDSVLELAKKRSIAGAGFFGAVDLMVKMSMLSVLGFGGQMVAEGALSVGELTSFLMYTIYVGFSFAGMSTFYTDLMKGVGASTRLFELLERSPKIRVADNMLGLQNIAGRIEFQNVSFRYPERNDVAIFRDFNLVIRSNETVALVGPSGSGKSSIAALLGRFYELDQENCGGRILIDETDISKVPANTLRSVMAAVTQEPPLFATTIGENIAYGRPNASIKEIQDAAMQANAHEFIMALPGGYETAVGERGQSLSGGQKQRIAIARALLRNPRILILDEATSALDIQSERLVQEAIDRAKHNRTVLLISHRLSTIRSADRIAVLNDGQIVEEGTFEELKENRDSTFYKTVLQNRE